MKNVTGKMQEKIELSHLSWKIFDLGTGENLETTLSIIDDALCFGFEFKVENHKLYYLETTEYC